MSCLVASVLGVRGSCSPDFDLGKEVREGRGDKKPRAPIQFSNQLDATGRAYRFTTVKIWRFVQSGWYCITVEGDNLVVFNYSQLLQRKASEFGLILTTAHKLACFSNGNNTVLYLGRKPFPAIHPRTYCRALPFLACAWRTSLSVAEAAAAGGLIVHGGGALNFIKNLS